MQQQPKQLKQLKSKEKEASVILNINHDLKDNESLVTKNYSFGSIYLGGVKALTKQILKQNNIKAVITVLDQQTYDKCHIAEKIEQLDDINQHMYFRVDSQDPQLQPYYEGSFDFIVGNLEKDWNVLVHCKSGKNKSAALVVAFITKKYKIGFEKAEEIVKARRDVEINSIFREELKKFLL